MTKSQFSTAAELRLLRFKHLAVEIAAQLSCNTMLRFITYTLKYNRDGICCGDRDTTTNRLQGLLPDSAGVGSLFGSLHRRKNLTHDHREILFNNFRKYKLRDFSLANLVSAAQFMLALKRMQCIKLNAAARFDA